MRITTFFLFLVSSFFISFSAAAQTPNMKLGEWKVHLPYTNARNLVETADKVYIGTTESLFSYDLEDFSLDTYTTVNGTSELNVSALGYCEPLDMLVVAYESGNIDILQNGNFSNISDIKRSNYLSGKRINHILISDKVAYFSCNFGIVAFDLEKLEVIDTYIIGENGETLKVNETAINEKFIMAATDEGIHFALRNAQNLVHFDTWQRDSEMDVAISISNIVFFNEKFYVLSSDGLLSTATEPNDWTLIYGAENWCSQSLTLSQNKLIMPEWESSCITGSATDSRLLIIDSEETISHLQDNSTYKRPLRAITDKNGQIWTADRWFGFQKFKVGEKSEPIAPNGPYRNAAFDIEAGKGEIWVGGGGVSFSTYNCLNTPNGFYTYKEGWWTNFTNNSENILQGTSDFMCTALHPSKNLVYIGSCGEGLLKYDYNELIQYKAESPIEGGIGDENTYRITDIAFDINNNLWMNNFGSPRPIKVLKDNGEWKVFNETPFFGGNPPNRFTKIVVDDYDQKWIIVHKEKVLVLNHGDNIDDESDDQYKELTTGAGRGSLPTNTVNCLTKDKDGAIWVGTSEGVGVFYCPYNVFNGGCDAIKPYVEVDGYGAYLLETEVINVIAVDGANRKWIGTSNGVWLMSADGTAAVEYFTTENSPLLSNNVLSVGIDDESGEVFFGTELGIVSYKGTATAGSFLHDEAFVYPNPVRPEYKGDIAIKGLAENAYVKITDVQGTLMYETRALGGQAVWNGSDYTGRRAATGVYLVFSSNRDGSDNIVAKVVIVN